MSRSRHYWHELGYNRVAAREEYKNEYGVAIDDPSIGAAFERCLAEQLDRETIEIPAHLAIAIMLRPRGTGQGRNGAPPTPKMVKRTTKLVVRHALALWKKLRANGTRDAKQEAAEQIIAEYIESGHPAYRHCEIRTVATLVGKMRLIDIRS